MNSAQRRKEAAKEYNLCRDLECTWRQLKVSIEQKYGVSLKLCKPQESNEYQRQIEELNKMFATGNIPSQFIYKKDPVIDALVKGMISMGVLAGKIVK